MYCNYRNRILPSSGLSEIDRELLQIVYRASNCVRANPNGLYTDHVYIITTYKVGLANICYIGL